ncbi:MAG: redoxin domain-containing protein [bacterium]|jgi:peroxiredoxin
MKRLTFLLVLLMSCGMIWAASDEPKGLEIGEKAPDFSLPGVDGKTYTLDDFSEAKILVMIFTCNHCPTAQAYEERIKKLVTDYGDKGVAVVAISPNDEKSVRLDEMGYTDLNDGLEDMKLRAEAHQFNFPYLYAGDKPEWCMSYGPAATPHVFIFDENRELRYQGRIDNADDPKKVTAHDTRNAIEALLAGVPVPVVNTRTFGCSIKYPDKRHTVTEFTERIRKEQVTVEKIDLEGIRQLMKNDSGKLRLINFWATFCGPCRAEFPDLVEIHHMYRHRNFELVTVSVDTDDKHDQVLEFLKEQYASTKNYHFMGDVYQLMEAVDPNWKGAIPYTLLVNAEGKIIYSIMDQIDPLKVKREIVSVIGRTYFD